VQPSTSRKEWLFVDRVGECFRASAVWDQGLDFRKALRGDAQLGKPLSSAEIDACVDLAHRFQRVDEIFVRVFGRPRLGSSG
jgi:hypothetical protein